MTDEVNETDIAIVGMAIRVPGASNPEEFWANLRNGVEATRPYTDEELLAKGVSQSTLADPNYVKAGIQLQDLDAFDPEFFGFSQKEAAILDPQHRQFYEICWEALERAGHPPETFEGAVGLFAGCGMGAYFTFNLLSNPELVDSVGLFLLRHTGNDKDFLSTRVSYAFNLHGPCVNVQTACSTSLVATHMAVQSLLARECDMALAGGVTIEIPHGVGYHYKEGEVLSPDGHCRTFDHRSKGTVFGSGAGVVVLRRLEDALRDGDHIHAVIKGSAINNDGARKVGYLAPSVDGQAACITEALAVSDVTADTLSYVECHGTATPVGDPIEIAALTQAFRDTTDKVGYCKVGSVKTNIGHLDTAAGVASLIKATLALEHKQIPPSLNFEAPNPRIGFEGSPFTVAAKLADWTTDGGPRRAGVNSLGVGGT
ncbi:MAG TPA: polyketide synthase, partial [Rhizobacter sp.]